MKPVNLYPVDIPVAAEAAPPKLGVVVGAAVGVATLFIVAGFFGMSHVESIKSESSKFTTDAAQARQETQSIEAQIESVGTPVVDGDKELARQAESTLVSAYTERVDFRLLATELQAIMAGTGGWYTKVSASAVGSVDSTSAGSTSISIEAVLPSAELAAGFNERVNSTRTMQDAVTTSVESEFLAVRATKKAGRYFVVKLTADLVDTVAPNKSGSSGKTTKGLVANGADEQPKLSLDPEPVAPAAKRAAATPQAKPAAPTNPFALAAGAAAGGGAK